MPSQSLEADFCVNARVNTNPATLGRVQVEPSIANNPADPLKLVAAYADSQNGPVFDFAPGVTRSVDGGRTWIAPSGGSIVPNPPGFIWGDRTLATHLAAGDSAIAWALGDTVYFSMIGFHNNASPPGGNCASGGLYVYRSVDAGNTWTLPAGGPVVANTTTIFRDKEYIAADANPLSPFAGNVYMAWDDDVYSGCPQNFPANFVIRHVTFSFSADDGATWSPPIILASGCLIAPVPAVAANGDVYVVWFDCNAGIRMMVRKSINGGASFGFPTAAATGLVALPSPLIGSSFRVQSFPSIATDPTNSDNVYVTWSSVNGASQADVFVSRSLDAGSTWGTPVRVNDDALGNPRDQFFPWMSVGADGTVRVMWGDDRLDLVNPGGKDYDIFMAESRDNGATFGPNFRVSTAVSNPDFDGFGGTFIGDYFGLSQSGAAAWDDMRESEHQIYGAPEAELRVPTEYATIQAAIDASSCGQTIILDDGVYTGAGNVNLDFGGREITVRSASGDPGLCIIDCQSTPDTRGFNFVGGETSDSIVEGLTIRNGLMTGVNPLDRGGAMHIAFNSNPTIRNCVFENNTALFGGAMLLFASSPTFTNCVYRNNAATSGGGGINSFGGGSETVTNCTFSGNSAGAGGAVSSSNNPTIVNSILWGDSPDEISGAASVSYSDVQGGLAGIGNINADPLFVSAGGGDLRLTNVSPCIDAADNTAPALAGITEDLDGNPRFVDNPCISDTGDGTPPIVDMGAYEFQDAALECCPSDVNDDGVTNVLDLIDLLLCFGQPAVPGCEAEDVNQDGSVDVLDLIDLLLAFGTACP